MKWQFWRWLFKGLDGHRPGLCSIFDWWLLFHMAAAATLTYFVEIDIKDAASTTLLPLASIFIGLSFAWAGNAQALMQTDEIESLAKRLPGGLATYAYKFQFAILIILITLCGWGLAGIGVFSKINNPCIQIAIEATLYFSASITIRECWHVILGSQAMLLMRHGIRGNSPKMDRD
ncbi:MAG: hypothetical protein M3O61_13315 [Gemmatimonadota bacterium]|nr:hypothetical protein [Gemmatimonadota bacterium]